MGAGRCSNSYFGLVNSSFIWAGVAQTVALLKSCFKLKNNNQFLVSFIIRIDDTFFYIEVTTGCYRDCSVIGLNRKGTVHNENSVLFITILIY